MENKEMRQKKDGEDMKKARYADGQSKPIDTNSENIIEEKDIIKEEKILTFNGKKVRETVGWFNFDKKYLKVCLYALFVIFWGAIIFIMIYEKIYGLFEKSVRGKKTAKPVRMLSLLLSYLLLVGFVTVAFVFVIPQIGESITELTNNIPVVYNNIIDMLANLHEKYPEIDTDFVSEKLNEMVPNLIKYGTNIVGNVIPMVFSISVSIVKVMINILLALIISVYMIVGRETFKHQGKRLVYSVFSETKGDTICKTLGECNDIFSAFLISKAIDSLIIGCLCCVIMNIIHLPYTVLISVIVGITNMIPYFGPFIGAVPGVLIYLCTSPKDALIFVIMIFILQQFDGLILGPRLLGQSTGLSPIWVIFGITVGGAYFGVVGMFIGVPVVAVFAFLLNKIISYRLSGKEIKALKVEDEESIE